MEKKRFDMNEQSKFWIGSFGDEYTKRNTFDVDEIFTNKYGVKRSELNEEFLSGVDKDAPIIEFGCNRGAQLKMLKKQGFTNLWGIEINKESLRIARKDNDINFIECSAYDTPFKDNHFEVVFTSGLLIHVNPSKLSDIMKEMYRISKKYIWCYEYSSNEFEEIEYRGNKNVLWKGDYLGMFLHDFNLSCVKNVELKYTDFEMYDSMFILKKGD